MFNINVEHPTYNMTNQLFNKNSHYKTLSQQITEKPITKLHFRPITNKKEMIGITKHYQRNLPCFGCTLPLNLSMFNDHNIVYSFSEKWTGRKYCTKCALRKGFCTEQDFQNYIDGLIQ